MEGAGLGECWQVNVGGERVCMDYLECVQESKRCMDRVLTKQLQ